MKDILLISGENRFSRDKTGGFVYTEDRLQYLEQKIRFILSFVKGEYFLDADLGIPYIPDFDLSKSEHRDLVMSKIQQTLLAQEGILALNYFSGEVDAKNRILTVYFTVKTDGGELSDEMSLTF